MEKRHPISSLEDLPIERISAPDKESVFEWAKSTLLRHHSILQEGVMLNEIFRKTSRASNEHIIPMEWKEIIVATADLLINSRVVNNTVRKGENVVTIFELAVQIFTADQFIESLTDGHYTVGAINRISKFLDKRLPLLHDFRCSEALWKYMIATKAAPASLREYKKIWGIDEI